MRAVLVVISIISLSTQLYSQNGWHFLGPNLGNNSNGDICVINKDTVYAIADGGIFLKTVDGGTTWTTRNIGVTGSFSDMQFINADTGYAVSQSGQIIKTVNGGETWEVLISGVPALSSLAIISPNKICAVGAGGVILISNDSGASWMKDDTTTKQNLTGVAFRNSDIGFIVGSNSVVLRTVDGGATWTNLNFGSTILPFQFNQHSLAVTSNYAYFISYDGYKGQRIYRSKDGNTWQAVFNMSSGIYIPWYGVHFVNDSTGYVMNSYCNGNLCGLNIYKTKNYGTAWTKVFTNDNPITTSLGSGRGKFDFVSDSIGFMLCGRIMLRTSNKFPVITATDALVDDDVKIYPNPFSTEATIEVGDRHRNATVIVYNSMGQQVIRIERIPDRAFTLQREMLSSGLYYLKLMQGSSVVAFRKIIITDR